MKLAYLVNTYPRVSHSFIRREILALEQDGHEVVRFSIRPVDTPLADEMDRCEASKVRILLGAGYGKLLAATACTAIARPGPFARALLMALRHGWRSDRGVLRHIAYLAEACLTLFDATGEERWLERARELADAMLEKFWDDEAGGFYMTGAGLLHAVTPDGE
ncbi:MAG: hypothetical protein ACE5GW_03095, partial [Planctomycetota bacterium]